MDHRIELGTRRRILTNLARDLVELLELGQIIAKFFHPTNLRRIFSVGHSDGGDNDRRDRKDLDVRCAVRRTDALHRILDTIDLGAAFEHSLANIERQTQKIFRCVIGKAPIVK